MEVCEGDSGLHNGLHKATKGAIRWTREAVLLERSEADCTRSAASKHPNSLPQQHSTSGPGCPLDGRPLAHGHVCANVIRVCTKQKIPPKSKNLFEANFPWFSMALGRTRRLRLGGCLAGGLQLASEHMPSGRPTGKHPKATPKEWSDCSPSEFMTKVKFLTHSISTHTCSVLN